MAFCGSNINLVVVEKKKATKTFRLSDTHATQTLKHIFLRAGNLQLMKEAPPPAAETSQHWMKKLSTGSTERKQQI